MKNLLLLILCIAFYFATFGQINSSQDSIRNEYLHKYKKNKIIGLSFLNAGGALILTGGIIDRVKQPELLAGFTYEFFGLISTLISVPFLIKSAHNKSKALMISLNPHPTALLQQSASFHPTFSLKIRF